MIKLKIEKPESNPPPTFTPKPNPDNRSEEYESLATEPLKSKKEERIIEFLYDIFQENEKTPEPSTIPKESDGL